MFDVVSKFQVILQYFGKYFKSAFQDLGNFWCVSHQSRFISGLRFLKYFGFTCKFRRWKSNLPPILLLFSLSFPPLHIGSAATFYFMPCPCVLYDGQWPASLSPCLFLQLWKMLGCRVCGHRVCVCVWVGWWWWWGGVTGRKLCWNMITSSSKQGSRRKWIQRPYPQGITVQILKLEREI